MQVHFNFGCTRRGNFIYDNLCIFDTLYLQNKTFHCAYIYFMRNYTKKGTNAENFMQISLLLKKIWYLKDSRNGHFAMHYSSFCQNIIVIHIHWYISSMYLKPIWTTSHSFRHILHNTIIYIQNYFKTSIFYWNSRLNCHSKQSMIAKHSLLCSAFKGTCCSGSVSVMNY